MGYWLSATKTTNWNYHDIYPLSSFIKFSEGKFYKNLLIVYNMKGSIFILVIAIIFLSSNVSAVCNLDASLINQDPYPAIPGDYVTIVFQLAGVENPD